MPHEESPRRPFDNQFLDDAEEWAQKGTVILGPPEVLALIAEVRRLHAERSAFEAWKAAMQRPPFTPERTGDQE